MLDSALAPSPPGATNVQQQRGALLDMLTDPNTPSVVEHSRQVFCNRNLHLAGVEQIGFDMDYTLARYRQANLDELTLQLTLERLCALGYPKSIYKIEPHSQFAIRGLVIDKQLGNIFKMDSHRHVGKVFHGFRALSEAEHRVYNRHAIRFTERYHLVDTLFALPEALLFAGLVDHFEHNPTETPISYPKLFQDLRAAIDLVHRDGSLKSEIMSNTEKYIYSDPELATTLHRMRSSGKRLFVMTNSFSVYTEHVMSFLLDGVLPEYPSWRNYFDIIITGAKKPLFFSGQEPFLIVDDAGEVIGEETRRLEKGVIYQGGNLIDFERMINTGGPTVLYVGDHIYGDILKSRKISSWRTCMIVQEMEEELQKAQLVREEISRRHDLELDFSRTSNELYFLRDLKRRSDTRFERLSADDPSAAQGDDIKQARAQLKHRIQGLRRLRKKTIQEIAVLAKEIEHNFNPYWGLVFKEGDEHSIFGKQVQDYACLYAGRVSNLGSYSPLHNFRAPSDLMPHEH